MRVAALYDIHGNLPALEAVLEAMRHEAIDEVVVGGDVFPGPMSNEALSVLDHLEPPVRYLRGNGDREVLEIARGGDGTRIPEAYRHATRWVAKRLDPDLQDRISTWPDSIELDVEGLGRVLFCHATPRSDSEIITERSADERLLEVCQQREGRLVVCGHTHMQFDRTVGDLRVINAGSIGMAYGGSAAGWLTLGPDVELRQTPYDLGDAARRIRATSFPQAEEFVTHYVESSPAAREMLDLFAKAELRI